MSEPAEKQRKALGKGLSALLPGRPSGQAGTATAPAQTGPATSLPSTAPPSKLPIEAIQPNPMQPRVVFQPERLEELAASIRANGIIQPLIVRRHDGAVPIGRGRAPLAGGKAGRADGSSGGDPRNRGSSAAGDGAYREHPARRPQRDRNRSCLRTPGPGSWLVAGRNRPPHWQRSNVDHECTAAS